MNLDHEVTVNIASKCRKIFATIKFFEPSDNIITNNDSTINHSDELSMGAGYMKILKVINDKTLRFLKFLSIINLIQQKWYR